MTTKPEPQIVVAYVEVHSIKPGLDAFGGYIFRVTGRHAESQLQYHGPDLGDWYITDLPPASKVIMVWEGIVENEHSEHHVADWEPWFAGKWRAATMGDLEPLLRLPAKESHQ
jgi:hypothetical protein